MRLSWDWEHAEVTKLAHDVAHAGDEAEKDCKNVVRESGEFLELLWKANAEVTAGAHGVHYPGTIESHAQGMEAVIHPNAAMPQGGMSFEYGSRNQPPHMDMNRAADIAFPAFHKQMADIAVIRL